MGELRTKLGVVIGLLLVVAAVAVLWSRDDLFGEDPEHIGEYRMQARREEKTRSP